MKSEGDRIRLARCANGNGRLTACTELLNMLELAVIIRARLALELCRTQFLARVNPVTVGQRLQSARHCLVKLWVESVGAKIAQWTLIGCEMGLGGGNSRRLGLKHGQYAPRSLGNTREYFSLGHRLDLLCLIARSRDVRDLAELRLFGGRTILIAGQRTVDSRGSRRRNRNLLARGYRCFWWLIRRRSPSALRLRIMLQ